MVRTAIAFCPGHISGYFRPVFTQYPNTTGSQGAGIVISEGVSTSVRDAPQNSVTVIQKDGQEGIISWSNGSPPVEYLLSRLGVRDVAVTTTCRLPISSGYGLSAAALLSTAWAVNALRHLDLSPATCARLAHESEIVHRTGLGDVAACLGGGRDCRQQPGVGVEVRRDFDLAEPFSAVTFGPLPTPSVLGSGVLLDRITAAYPGRCPRDPPDLFRLSRAFAEKAGLITQDVRSALEACDLMEIPASMTMLGNGVFAYGADAAGVLDRFGTVYRLSAAGEGVRLVESG